MFRKILIANRGEIAIRIARTCRDLGIRSVAIYSEADRNSPHVRVIDEAVCVGPPASQESYLNVDAILSAARVSCAEAVHPGYGFLSENADFARAVREAGFVFIGPAPEAIAAMGDKVVARRLVSKVGVPVVPAVQDPPSGEADLLAAARDLGFPLLVKAAAGGGGKGMRIVRGEADFLPAYAAAEREARNAFGNGRLFLERYFDRPRHIEVQILADQHGKIIHLGERECSIQRRYQKVVEESPSPAVTAEMRSQLTNAAIAAAESVGYTNAGTVEFLLADDGRFYFLEMNTRLQVEHPVTEWVSGIDLVEAQIRIANGEPLWMGEDDVRPRGHAIECRVYAEDPAQHFLPSPGRVALLHEPQGPGVRVDSGICTGHDVPLHYDPMLAKLSVWGANREAARRRMQSALREYVILGLTTNLPFLHDVVAHPEFAAGRTHTHFIAEHFSPWCPGAAHADVAAIAAALHTVLAPRSAQNATGPAAVPTPWQTLGAWRVGEGKGTPR